MIAISLLDADLLCLAEEVERVLIAGVDSIYIDFSDCRGSTGMVLAPKICCSLREYGFRCPISVLLRNRVTDSLAQSLCEGGANRLILEAAAIDRLGDNFMLLKESCSLGISISSGESLEKYSARLPYLDVVMIDIGLDDSSELTMEITKEARALINKVGGNVELAVAGNLDETNIGQLAESGVNVFVLGKSIFSASDYYSVVSKYRKLILSGRKNTVQPNQ